ncbi:MAG: MFS transporter, partial [Candidatus Lokiarchaeota archaeon]
WRASSNSVGGVIWPFLGGALGALSWHFPFAIYLIGIPLAIISFLTFPDVSKETQTREEISKGNFLDIFRANPIIFVLYLFIFLSNLLLYSIVIFLPPKLKYIGIVSPFYIGIFLSLMTIVAGTISFLYEKIKAKISYKRILIIAFLAWIIGFSLIYLFNMVLIIIIGIMFFGLGQGMILPTLMLWTGEKAPQEYKGSITSYLGTFGYLGQFLNPILFSPLSGLWSYNIIFMFSAFISFACLITIIIISLKY